mmetsp:Transcript_2256/g.7554  ORF Transcript_2256/g.7554 Transcript_2256/m.7554 type:complete len:288 (-) Transcript_2256:74-937(-)
MRSALEEDLLVLVPGGNVHRDVHARARLGPHVVPGHPEVEGDPHPVTQVLDELIRGVLEVANLLELRVAPEVGVLQLQPPRVLDPFLLHLLPSELLQHMAGLVDEGPVQAELSLPVPLQGAELADIHLARPALRGGRPAANLAHDDELGTGVDFEAVEGDPLLELVEHEVLAALKSGGHPPDVPELHALLPRVVHPPPLLVPEGLVRPLHLGELLGAPPGLVRVMQPGLLPESPSDLLGGRPAIDAKNLIVQSSLQILHVVPRRAGRAHPSRSPATATAQTSSLDLP